MQCLPAFSEALYKMTNTKLFTHVTMKQISMSEDEFASFCLVHKETDASESHLVTSKRAGHSCTTTPSQGALR